MARNFPHWLKAYLDWTKASEAPDMFHFWTGVSTIAGALRRRVWREENIFQWIPNFYIIFVAPAGIATKSTTINLGMSLLSKVPDVYFGQDSGSWQGLGDSLAASTLYFTWPDNPDGPDEKLPMSALTLAISELGTFFDPQDEQAMSFLTDMWDGRKRAYKHKTKHSGSIEIQHPFVNMIGATTPSWLQRNMPENLISDGLLSRTIFVYAEKKRQYVAFPSKSIRGDKFKQTEKALIEDLTDISQLVGNYVFEDEIYRDKGWMETWHYNNANHKPLHMASGRYDGYISRKQTHLVKLAMILSASKRGDLTIIMEDVIEADALLTDAEHSMLKVFESVGIVDEAKHVAELVQFVRAHKWLSSRDLYRLCHNTMQEKDFQQALRLAVEGDLLEVTARNGLRGVSPKGSIH